MEKNYREAEWLGELDQSHIGRSLKRHLERIENSEQTYGFSGAAQEAVMLRRIFLSSLQDCVTQGKAWPCGLPERLKKYIVLANLSGEHHMYTSNSHQIMRMLCRRSWQLDEGSLRQNLSAFEAFADSRPPLPTTPNQSFVLVTYNLPWQAGVGSAYWEVNSVVICDKRVRVSEMSFSNMSHAMFGSTESSQIQHNSGLSLSNGILDYASDAQKLRVIDMFTAFDVDAKSELAVTSDQTLKSTLRVMQSERSALQSRVRELQGVVQQYEKTEKEHEEKQRELAATIKTKEVLEEEMRDRVKEEIVKGVAKEKEELQKQLCDRTKEVSKLQKSNAKLKETIDDMRKKSLAKDTLHNSITAKLTSDLEQRRCEMEDAARKYDADAREAEKEHKREVEAIRKNAEKDKHRLEDVIRSKKQLVNQLSESCERKDEEKLCLEDDLRTARQALEQAMRSTSTAREAASTKPKGTVATNTNASTATHTPAATQTPREGVPYEVDHGAPSPAAQAAQAATRVQLAQAAPETETPKAVPVLEGEAATLATPQASTTTSPTGDAATAHTDTPPTAKWQQQPPHPQCKQREQSAYVAPDAVHFDQLEFAYSAAQFAVHQLAEEARIFKRCSSEMVRQFRPTGLNHPNYAHPRAHSHPHLHNFHPHCNAYSTPRAHTLSHPHPQYY